MAAPLIQASGKQTSSAVGSLTSDPITTTSGSVLFASPSRQSAVAFPDNAITDSYGNTWHKAWKDSTSATNGSGGLWYAYNIVGGAGHTVTATLASGTDFMALALAEFATTLTTDPLIATEHTVNAAPPPNADPPLSSGLLAVSAGQLLIGTSSVSHGDFRPVSQGLFTDDFRLSGTMGVLVSHAFVNAVGAYHFDYASAQFAIGQGTAGIATFKCTNGAFVQGFGKQGVFLAPTVVTDPVTTVAGNHLAVVCTLYSTQFTTIPITDNHGNIWQQAWVDNSGTGTFNGNAACYYAEDIVGGAGLEITFTPPAGEFFFAIGAIETSGVDLVNSLDRTAHGHAAVPPYLSGDTAATSQADELLVGGGSIVSGGPYGYSIVPEDWFDLVAIDAENGGGHSGVLFSYRLAPADGNYDFEMSNGIGGATAFEAVGIASFILGIALVCDDPDGRVGVAYSGALIVTGGVSPYVFSIAVGTLPPGLTIDASTGLISGTPTLEGVYPFTGMVTDDDGNTALCACVITILHAVITDLNVTWVFDATESQWHQRMGYDENTDSYTRWRVRGCAAVGSKILVGDFSSGDLCLLDMETFTDNGDRIKRERSAPYLSGENQILALDQVECGIQAGVGNVDDPNPVISFSLSKNSGETFGTPVDTSMGVSVDFNARARWRRRGQGRADRLVAKVTSIAKVRQVWGPGLWIRSTSGTGEM